MSGQLFDKEVFNSIFNIIENLTEQPEEELEEQVAAPTTMPLEQWIPDIRITELWGEPGNGTGITRDRKIINMLSEHVYAGGAASQRLEERIKRLESFLNISKCPANMTLQGTFARIVLLEIFAAILHDFTEQAGGFLLEALLAGLGKGAQLTEPEDGSGLPITDIRVGGNSYSLKLLKGAHVSATGSKTGATKISGSIQNLFNELLASGSVTYLAFYRVQDQATPGGSMTGVLDVARFVIDKSHVFAMLAFDLAARTRTVNFKKYWPNNAEIQSLENWTDILDYLEEQDFETMVRTFDYHKTQFHLSENQMQEYVTYKRASTYGSDIGGYKHWASLDMSRGNLVEKANMCAIVLQQHLIPLYASMKKLTDNVNFYFLGKKGEKGKSIQEVRTEAAGIVDNVTGKELPEAWANVTKADIHK